MKLLMSTWVSSLPSLQSSLVIFYLPYFIPGSKDAAHPPE
jgi:hypothetical protein